CVLLQAVDLERRLAVPLVVDEALPALVGEARRSEEDLGHGGRILHVESRPMIPLRGGAEIAGRLGLAAAERILLVEAPPEFETAVRDAVAPGQELRSTEERGLRAVKERYDLIVLWQESRVGSRAVLDVAVKRLAPGGRLWIATALRKVSGPRTPAIH